MNEKTPACQTEEHGPEQLILPSEYYIPRNNGGEGYAGSRPPAIDSQQMELCSDLAVLRQRLAIAALVDIPMRQQDPDGKLQWVYPIPALYLDGKPPYPTEDIEDLGITRHYFFSPRAINTKNGLAYILIPNDAYGGSLDTKCGVTHGLASTYIGSACDPSDADGKIFEKPLPYDQDVYDQAVEVWRKEIAARLPRQN